MKFYIKPAKPAKSPKNYPDIDHTQESVKIATTKKTI